MAEGESEDPFNLEAVVSSTAAAGCPSGWPATDGSSSSTNKDGLEADDASTVNITHTKETLEKRRRDTHTHKQFVYDGHIANPSSVHSIGKKKNNNGQWVTNGKRGVVSRTFTLFCHCFQWHTNKSQRNSLTGLIGPQGLG